MFLIYFPLLSLVSLQISEQFSIMSRSAYYWLQRGLRYNVLPPRKKLAWNIFLLPLFPECFPQVYYTFLKYIFSTATLFRSSLQHMIFLADFPTYFPIFFFSLCFPHDFLSKCFLQRTFLPFRISFFSSAYLWLLSETKIIYWNLLLT